MSQIFQHLFKLDKIDCKKPKLENMIHEISVNNNIDQWPGAFLVVESFYAKFFHEMLNYYLIDLDMCVWQASFGTVNHKEQFSTRKKWPRLFFL